MKQERKRRKKKDFNSIHCSVEGFCQRVIRKFSNDFYLIQIALRFLQGQLQLVEQSDCGRIHAGTPEHLCPCSRHCCDKSNESKNVEKSLF